jgi:hypothetical protein
MTEPTPINVDTSVSLALHPLTISPIGKVLGAEHPVYVAATQALGKMYSICSDMTAANRAAYDENDVRNAVAIDVAKRTGKSAPGSHMGPHGRQVLPLDPSLATALNDSIEKAYLDRCGPAFQPAFDRLRQNIGTLRAEVAASLRDPRGESIPALHDGTEIRSHLKSLPAIERHDFIRKAILAGDKVTVAAVLNKQPYMSGLDDKTHALLKTAAQDQFAGDKAKHLAAMRSLEEKMFAAGKAANEHRLTNLVTITAKQSVSLAAMNKLRSGGTKS